MQDDFLKQLYSGILAEIKQPIDFIAEYLESNLVKIADRVGNACLVGGMNSVLKKPILNMDKLYKKNDSTGKLFRKQQVLPIPGTSKKVILGK